jgi:quercetin dioxygenase-like cupin family protein
MRFVALGLALLVACAAHAAGSDGVTVFPALEVDAAFAKGMPLLERDNYKIHASRRVAPGQGEVHEKDTDIIHVLQGTALFVTGGTLVDGKATAADEIRGAAIAGGTERRLAPGDVVVVPKGVPHWFKQVDGPFLYYVVKVQ